MKNKKEKSETSVEKPQRKKRKPVYLKDRKTSSGVTFWV